MLARHQSEEGQNREFEGKRSTGIQNRNESNGYEANNNIEHGIHAT